MIPPLLENGLFVTDFAEKAQIFNDYFILQCTTIDTGSEIPQDAPVTTNLITDFVISEEKILNIIRSLNPNKAHGWDEISVRMIKLSDDALVLPLKTIFINCLRRGIFPEIWKYANVVPVHKKNEKNVKANYRPISLLPIFGKILEKLITILFTHILQHMNYSTRINQVFAQETQQSTSYSRYHTLFLKLSTVILRLMFAPCTLTFRRHLIGFGTMVLFTS